MKFGLGRLGFWREKLGASSVPLDGRPKTFQWRNPWAPKAVISTRTHTDGSAARLTTLVAGIVKPFARTDWPNPRGYIPGVSLRTHHDGSAQRLTSLVAGIVRPTSQTDWPLPERGRVPGVSLRTHQDGAAQRLTTLVSGITKPPTAAFLPNPTVRVPAPQTMRSPGGLVLSLTPAIAPTLTLISLATDNQPDFLVAASAVDLPVGAVVTVYAYTNVGLTTLEDLGQGTVTIAGTLTITNQLGPLTDGTKWYVARTSITGYADSANSNTETNTIDATAPTLSSPTGTKTGQTTASGGISTNEANGSLFWVVDTGSTPSAPQVKAGQDSGGSAADGDDGSQAVSATGAQATILATGLTAATTYKFFYMHEDAAGNQSSVSPSATSFTTDSAGHTADNVLRSPVTMSDNTTPSPFVASSSSDFSGSFEPWKVFDGNPATIWAAASTVPQWVKIDLGTAQWCASYNLTMRSTSAELWIDWVLEGSADDSAWTTADTQTGISFTTGETKTFTPATPLQFRYWRWTVSSTANSNVTLAAAEIYS